ncbi:MAG: hypothetical protein WDM79_00700 [Terricaulis sp.]
MPLQKPLPNWTARIVVMVLWCIVAGAILPIIQALAALNAPEWVLAPIIIIWLTLLLAASVLLVSTWSPTLGKRLSELLSSTPWSF